jgi:hypothetical protein
MTAEAIKPGTPLPWQVTDEHTTWKNWIQTVDREGSQSGDIAEVGTEWPAKHMADAEKDAAYIVHTANNYPTLAAHAERMAEALERVLDDTHSYESEGQTRDYARQALTEYRSSQL